MLAKSLDWVWFSQNSVLDARLTVLENLTIKLNSTRRCLQVEIERLVSQSLVFRPLSSNRTGHFGGQKNVVWTLHEPCSKVPTCAPRWAYNLGLDIQVRRVFGALLNKLKKKRMTIGLTAHYLNKRTMRTRFISDHGGLYLRFWNKLRETTPAISYGF